MAREEMNGCTGAFWEVVTLRPSLWRSMRNGESVTGAKWSRQPTGWTSSTVHAHTHTHTYILCNFFSLLHNFVLEKRRLVFRLPRSNFHVSVLPRPSATYRPLFGRGRILAGRQVLMGTNSITQRETACQDANGVL